MAAAAVCFSDVRLPEGRGIRAETYSRRGCVVQGARSECDDAADDHIFRGHSVIGAADLNGSDGADREAHVRGLLFVAEAGVRETILAGRAVRVRNAVVGAGADCGVSWICFRQPGAIGRGRAEIWGAVWN